MKKILFALLVASSFSSAGPAASAPLEAPSTEITKKPEPAAHQVARMPVGDWVIERPVPAISPARRLLASNGEFYLLSDDQIRWKQGGFDEFQRAMIEVTDRSGLEAAAQLKIGYDPGIESIAVNQLRIWRDGRMIDRLADTEPTIIRREGQLDDGVIDGRLTVLLQLRDVRVGDIIEYSWTKNVFKSMWPDQKFGYLQTQWSIPVGRYTFRMSWPSRFPVVQKSFGTSQTLKSHVKGENTIYELTVTDPDPVPGEMNVPRWRPQWGFIQFSTMPGWRDVLNWVRPLYNVDQTLPPDFAAKINAIGKRFATPEDRVTAVLRLVQDEIRYVGDEMGDGSYRPRAPAKVVAAGFGDCKDKSVLLAAALHILGIKADVALANPSTGYGINNFLPSPGLFNHALVRVDINGAVYWLDPTLSHQGGRLPDIAIPDYGYVLPLTDSSPQLERIILHAPSEPLMQAKENYTISENGPEAMTLSATTAWRGVQADAVRATFAQRSAADMNRYRLDYYAKFYPGIKAVEPGKVSDDRDANLIILTEKYTLSRAAFDAAKLVSEFPLRADAVLGLLPKPVANGRRNPLYIPNGLYEMHEIRVAIDTRATDFTDDVNRQEGPVNFTRQWSSEGATAVVRYTLKTDINTNVVAAADAPGVIKLASDIEDLGYVNLHIDKVALRPFVLYNIKAATLAPFEGDLLEIMSLIRLNTEASNIDALGKLGVLQGKVPPKSELAGLVGVLKGATLLDLDRKEAALTELDEGLKNYHGLALFNMFQANLKAEKLDYLGAADALTELATRHPDNANQITKQMLRYVFGKLGPDKSDAAREKRFELALALARADYKLEKESEPDQGLLTSAVKGLLERGRSREAQQLAVKLNTVDGIAVLLIDRRYASLWPSLEKRAGPGLQRIVDSEIGALEKQLKDDPKNLVLRRNYIHVLRLVGRDDDAIKADDGLLADTARVEAAGSDAFWLINELANALVTSGRRADGLAAFDKLKQLDVARYPELVSMNINAAALELISGNYARALSDADALLGPGDQHMSAYGRAFARSVRSCALRELGRREEADAELKIMSGASTDNLPAYADTLACAGDGDGLEKVIQTALEDRDMRQTVLLFVQNYDKPDKLTTFEQRIRQQFSAALNRPALQARLKQLGRVIKLPGQLYAWPAF